MTNLELLWTMLKFGAWLFIVLAGLFSVSWVLEKVSNYFQKEE
jgi:uncharacterized membrane protein